MKNIVIYWCSFRGKKSDKLSFLGSKKKVYLEVFNEISKKANLHLVYGKNNYLGGLEFKNYHTYENNKFIKHNSRIVADAVLDRSRGLDFPTNSLILNRKVLNQIDFKKVAGDKRKIIEMYPDYCPKTYIAENNSEYKKVITNFEGSNLVVVKPVFGLKGKDVTIKKVKELSICPIKFPVIVQEFIETKGFFGNKNKRHDLRIVIIDGKPVYSVVRHPRVGDGYLANVAQGGSIEQVMLSDLPPKVLSISKKIAQEIKKKYSNPFYSIDFGFSGKKAYIFEFNNFIGFPLIERNHKEFVKCLAKVLLEKANLK